MGQTKLLLRDLEDFINIDSINTNVAMNHGILIRSVICSFVR